MTNISNLLVKSWSSINIFKKSLVFFTDIQKVTYETERNYQLILNWKHTRSILSHSSCAWGIVHKRMDIKNGIYGRHIAVCQCIFILLWYLFDSNKCDYIHLVSTWSTRHRKLYIQHTSKMLELNNNNNFAMLNSNTHGAKHFITPQPNWSNYESL